MDMKGSLKQTFAKSIQYHRFDGAHSEINAQDIVTLHVPNWDIVQLLKSCLQFLTKPVTWEVSPAFP